MTGSARSGRSWDVAVIGATGLVGRTMLKVLEERAFPAGRLIPFASDRSSGQSVEFRGKSWPVQTLNELALRSCGAQIALLSAGATVSRYAVPWAVSAGMVAIDNSSAFRMDDQVPLVVPEVNAHRIPHGPGVVANPNCSTIQMVVALKPIHDRWKVKRVVVATYQSVTGAGQKGVEQLRSEMSGGEATGMKFPHRIAGNLIPQIDAFLDDGSTKEEEKMRRETPKIMEAPDIHVAATCVRVPVVGGHSEAVSVECREAFAIDEVREALRRAPGVMLLDDPGRSEYPMPIGSEGKDDVFVGRLRRDPSVPHGMQMWVVADNLRKGAATNAVQIAEAWIGRQS